MTTPAPTRAASLREALATRVVVADGAMGTMLQAHDPSLEDFQQLEGCSEILNITRPDIVRSVHAEYFAVGVDCVETNTFGANFAALGEYDIPERVFELSEAGARLAREVADEFTESSGRQRWVLGSMGSGTKLPTLGHAPYVTLRHAYQQNAEGMIAGGADALLVETTQDLLQTKAAVLGARRALEATGADLPVICSVTVETTGTMLLGSEIGAALTALEPLGIDMIGLNCATGPAEMSEHLRYVARHSRVPLSCMPNAGLPVLGKNGAHYPLTPGELADAHETFVGEYGLSLVGGCCGTTPEHLRQVVERVREVVPRERDPRPEPGAASLYQSVPFRQDTSYMAIGERTNANGSKKFREAMLEGRWDDCGESAREQIREGAHMLDLCVDYVGRDGVADMAELAGRFATASTLPIVLDSTEVEVIRAGLEKLGGRAVINSVNYEDDDGPESRFAQVTRLAREHGAALIALTIDEEGQARTVEKKVAVAERIIDDLTGTWGISESDILIDTLTFTICTGQEESRKDGVHTIEAIRELKRRHPQVQTTLGLSNISFGLNPAARILLNSVFLDECFTFPRQRRGRRLCLADFFRPEESGERDVVGLQLVTVGSKIGAATAELFESHSYRDYLELHGLAVQLAEALAEYCHARVRGELGFAGEDPTAMEDMFALRYRGARFSLGYGACPDLEDRAKIAYLLEPERIGVQLSEEFQLHPEQSTDAIVVHHPDATYFNTGVRA